MKDLSNKTVKELRDIAKQYDIKGRWDMTKHELIEAIGNIIGDNNIPEDISKVSEGSQNVKKTTLEYLKNAEVGTLVAFKRNMKKDIAMSGKLVSLDDDEKVTIESKRGTLFKVDIQNIVWVKTGERWPKWVFVMFSHPDKEV